MISLDGYPKSIKKTLRYIKQDAPLSTLMELEKILLKSIHNRKEALKNKENTSALHNKL